MALPLTPRWWRQAVFAQGWLKRAGDTLQRRQNVVRRIQWLLAGIYYFLLIVPAVLPQPAGRGEIFSSLAGWAEILFWGLWWPAVILSMMVFGQFWCGVFCPDGALTEAASRRGRGGRIPAWVRWPGWPLLAFSVVLVYEHLSDAYRTPRALLLSLGGLSLLALACGYFLGRGRRVWCRYLCPAGSMFSLLARCAVFHFKVDREAWDAAPKPLPRAVECPPLLDVRRLRSNEKCSMCGRCSGHRNAVQLAVRPPGSEIVCMEESEIRRADAFAVCAVLIGLSYGAMHGRDGVMAGMLQAAGWPGGILALASLSLTALVLASVVALLLWLAGNRRTVVASHLAYGLIPLASCGLFLGALDHAFRLLREAAVPVEAGTVWIRLGFVLMGSGWSWMLGSRILDRWQCSPVAWSRAVLGLLLGSLAGIYLLAP